MQWIDKLIKLAGPALHPGQPLASDVLLQLAGRRGPELAAFLSKRNGFYAFEGALHIFPTAGDTVEKSIEFWNKEDTWKDAYSDFAKDCLFFGEDAFGVQFCIKNNHIYTFDPETGELTFIAETLDEWAKLVVENYNELTGYSLAHDWQRINGGLPPGKRLVPVTPFVLGGEFAVVNLIALDAVESMKYRADVAKQLTDLPDGAQVTINLIN